MRKYKALIFDLDGVVIDTEALHAEAKRTAFEKYEIKVPKYLYSEFIGRSDNDMIEHVIKCLNVTSVEVKNLLKYKQDIYKTIRKKMVPIDGSIDFIRFARSHFDKFALTTSATKQNQQFAFNKFGLDQFFDVIVTAEDISNTKPDPEPYLKTIERLDLRPSSCLVIEDSLNGIMSAKNAGCSVAAISTSYTRENLKEVKADYIVCNFKELAFLLGLTSDDI